MFRKVNNRFLITVFFILLIFVVVVFFFDSGKNERTFRDVLVNIDTTAVTEIQIISKANNNQPLKIFKQNNKWLVELMNGKNARVPNQKIEQTFKELTSIMPKRLAARGQDKWSEYQVDSSGTRIQVMEGNSTTLDIVIGRFNYQQQTRNVSTYVRLYNDKDVYEVEGFLAMTFNQNADAFRDGTVVKGDFNTWNQLVFDYPADSSFSLTKKNGNWFINDNESDSAKTVDYLRRLSNLTKNNFADEFEIKQGQNPNYKLTIANENLEFIEVFAYIDSINYVIISSQNPETKFDGRTFGNTIFVGRNSLFK